MGGEGRRGFPHKPRCVSARGLRTAVGTSAIGRTAAPSTVAKPFQALLPSANRRSDVHLLPSGHHPAGEQFLTSTDSDCRGGWRDGCDTCGRPTGEAGARAAVTGSTRAPQ